MNHDIPTLEGGRTDVLSDWRSIRARAGRLLRFDQPIVSRPIAGDHVLNPHLPEIHEVPDNLRDAAVLFAVMKREPEATVLFTLRNANLSSHAGQIALPGGKIDDTDTDPLAAALREADEEVGLSPQLVEPLGYGDTYATRSGFKIVPVVGLVSPDARIRANPHEVADVFEVPLSHLMSPANHARDSREWGGSRRYFYTMPYQDRYIWGVTAGIVRSLFERLYR